METFAEKVYPMFVGRSITYLELGVFEGQSMVWMLQHVLTHPESWAVGIDPWLMSEKLSNTDMMAVQQHACYNVYRHPHLYRPDGSVRAQLYQANSAELLRRMLKKDGFVGIKRNSVDLCLIDGNHNALAVWDDARLVLQLLKPGGVMLFDDIENDVPKKDHVKEGVELFLKEAGDAVKLLWKHKHMEAYIKQ
jgi:hypothetical protein